MDEDKRDEGLPAVVAKRRRSYSPTLKREMVEATLGGDESVSQVARRFNVNANQLFRWRRQYLDGVLPLVKTPPGLLPVEVSDRHAGTGELELHFQRGVRLVVRGEVDTSTLRTVLQELTR